MKSKIQIGVVFVSSKNGKGVITKIITKSTGYVEVDYNGTIKKEMAFNLVDENGQSMKAKLVQKELTAEQIEKKNRSHARFMQEMNMAVLKDNFLDSQIQSNSYNRNLIR